MTNEQYLIASYFAVGILSLGLGLATVLWLRRSFMGVMQAVPAGRFARILRKLFSLGIVLPALVGFFSVTFRSCERNTYEKIIADRAYLVAKNQEQLSASLSYIVVALLVWGFIVAGALLIIKRYRAAKTG